MRDTPQTPVTDAIVYGIENRVGLNTINQRFREMDEYSQNQTPGYGGIIRSARNSPLKTAGLAAWLLYQTIQLAACGGSPTKPSDGGGNGNNAPDSLINSL